MNRFSQSIISCLLLAGFLHAGAENAVVRLTSHGGSGTVIHTQQGKTWILTCAHCFERKSDRSKPIVIDAPSPTTGEPQRGGIRLVAIDHKDDLALLEMQAGPLPYVCPVARPGHKIGRELLSVGYDNGKLPPQVRRATFLKHDGNITWTKEPPWHGRSGGALIDERIGELVGVVHAYTCNNPARRPENGLYVSHSAVVRFLRDKCHWVSDPNDQAYQQSLPEQQPIAEAQPLPEPPSRQYVPISQGSRVPNRTGSQCVWSSLETLARHLGIQQLYGLTRAHRGLAGPGDVAPVLRQAGVRYRMAAPGQRDRRILEEAIAAGYGAAIGLRHQHMVTLVGIEGDRLRCIENMDPHCGEKTYPLSSWDGWAIVLYPTGQDQPADPFDDGNHAAPQRPWISEELQPSPRPRYFSQPAPGGCRPGMG